MTDKIEKKAADIQQCNGTQSGTRGESPAEQTDKKASSGTSLCPRRAEQTEKVEKCVQYHLELLTSDPVYEELSQRSKREMEDEFRQFLDPNSGYNRVVSVDKDLACLWAVKT